MLQGTGPQPFHLVATQLVEAAVVPGTRIGVGGDDRRREVAGLRQDLGFRLGHAFQLGFGQVRPGDRGRRGARGNRGRRDAVEQPDSASSSPVSKRAGPSRSPKEVTTQFNHLEAV